MEINVLKEYPFLQERDYNGNIIAGEIMGLEIPRGWFNLFMQMCGDIKPILEKHNMLDTFYFVQVKEKYNMLRCYPNASIPEIDEVLGKYEQMARYICTQCGQLAIYETHNYIASYCNDCWKDYVRHEPGEFITPETSYTQVIFSKDDRQKKIVSFQEEWDRYWS